MPRRFLSQAERTRLSQFPAEVSDSDSVVYFTLTPADLELVEQRRRDENHLGFALLLCTLRYLGHFPADLRQSPANVVTYVAYQLRVSPESLAEYGDRDETRWEHLPIVMEHLGFRRVNATDKEALVAWLGERALEHERPTMLLQQACERLYQLRLVRPAITTMEELVTDGRQWAEEKTIEVLVKPLPEQVRQTLDTLLVNSEEHGMAPIVWLRRFATGHSDRDILEALDKLVFIRQWAVTTWQGDELPLAGSIIWPKWRVTPVRKDSSAKNPWKNNMPCWLPFCSGRMKRRLMNSLKCLTCAWRRPIVNQSGICRNSNCGMWPICKR